MNKTEAKEKLHNLAYARMNNKPDDLNLADVMRIVDHIDEPEKVKLPKYVVKQVNFYTSVTGRDLYETMEYLYGFKETADWLSENERTFARAWLDGFEIEEQKYIVEIPNPNSRDLKNSLRLVKAKGGDVIIMASANITDNFYLTESEIKKDFQWAWDAGFAKPAEEVY